jgi:hypothetical protein
MSDRRSYHHHHNTRQTFEEKYRTLENELKRKNETIDSLRNEYADTSQHQHDLSRSFIDQSVRDFPILILYFSLSKLVRNGSQRSNTSSNWNALVRIGFISYCYYLQTISSVFL